MVHRSQRSFNRARIAVHTLEVPPPDPGRNDELPVAHDGVDALVALKANGGIDLVVTDINMPRMDGLTLLQKLQESEEKASTIIVSAYGDMANRPDEGIGEARFDE
jgi:CheY-like chemotaxis protein